MLKEKINQLFSKHFFALSIIFIGVILRLLFIYFQGLSNDELSAVMRCHFPDLQTLMHEGVRNGDMHPALYQSLMWFWMKIFGESELAIRSLSLLFYVTNMLLLYSIACQFFSKNQGIMALALYSSLTFLIINTTFSRPYNSGTFFLLLLVYAVLNYQRQDKKLSWSLIMIIVAFAGAMYSHYFAFLTAGVIGFCAFFYLDKNKDIYLLLAGIFAVLIFLPHLSITLHQLGNGGLGWLGKPTTFWLFDFFTYFFNQSGYLFLVVVTLLIILHYKFPSKGTKEQRFFMAIFLLSYLLGHFLSIFYTPILREIVMLFLLPFLLLVVLKPFITIAFETTKKIGLITLLVFTIHSISFAGLFKPKNFPVFREIGELGNYFDATYGKQNITYISSFNSIDYINYYRTNKLIEKQKEWDAAVFYKLFERIKTAKTPYFVYQYSNHYHSVLLYELIRKEYPKVLFHQSYFNSSFTFFGKKGRTASFLTKKTIIPSSGKTIESQEEFFGNQKISVKKLRKKNPNSIYLSIETFGEIDIDHAFHLVAVLEHKGEMIQNNPLREMYVASNQSQFITQNKREKMILAFELPIEASDEDDVHFYFWNPEKMLVKVQVPQWNSVQINH